MRHMAYWRPIAIGHARRRSMMSRRLIHVKHAPVKASASRPPAVKHSSRPRTVEVTNGHQWPPLTQALAPRLYSRKGRWLTRWLTHAHPHRPRLHACTRRRQASHCLQPSQVKSSRVESSRVESSRVRSGQVRSRHVTSRQVRSGQVRSAPVGRVERS